MPMRFSVGFKHKGNVNHLMLEAADALIAALKARPSTLMRR
jgi:hypothetical protein